MNISFGFINNYIINATLSILPKTRCFKVKVYLLNFLGHKIKKTAKITGDIKIYGRGKILVGENSWIGLGCTFYTSPHALINIGDNCDIAPQVTFHTGTHEIDTKERRAGVGFSESITIENGSWIGVNSTLLAGSYIESGCVIAAGAVLLKRRYINNHIYGGVPARLISSLKHQ